MLNFLKGAGVPKPDPKDLVEKAARGEATVVDVRDLGELKASGKAENAVHIPLAVIRMQGDPNSPDFNAALDRTKPVIVYCASGGRSSMAAQVLKGYGFEVHNIGGLGHWAQAGGKVVKA